jgi:hypothetical protein
MTVCPFFGWNDRNLPTPGGDVEDITVITLYQNGTYSDYLRG